MSDKDEQLIFRCFECIYKKDFDTDLIKRFENTYKFCDRGINKFILLLRKGVYPNEYMDDWEKFNETSLPKKEYFYSSLNMKYITDFDHRHPKRVFKNFDNKNIRDYHDLYVQNDTLLLADVFENFRNKCIEIDELDPAHFLSAPGLVWQACLKKAGVELELLADIDMLLTVEKGIRRRICHAIYRCVIASSKYMKYYVKNIESSYLMYLDANNLYDWAMYQKLPVNGFKWKKYF